MMDFENIIKKLSALPWRWIVLTIGAAFLVATVVTTITAWFMMPSESKTIVGGRVSPPFVTIPEPGVTLDQSVVQLILDRNIFNSEGKVGEEKSRPKTAEDLSITDLPIRVLGIIYGGDPYSGIALVENTAKKVSNSFLAGDQIEADATLERIEIDRIIILRADGRREAAMLERQDIIRLSRRRGKSKSQDKTSSRGGYATEAPPEEFSEPGFDRKGRAIEMSMDYKNKLLGQDFAQVLQDAKASPNMIDGELRGFRIDRIRNDSIYQKAGFQNGDVIEEINGIPLSDTAQAIKLLQSLRNEADIEIRFSRGGSKQNMNMKVK